MKKDPKRYWLVFLFTFPADIVVFILVLFIWLLWGTRLHWNHGLWCFLKPKSWPARSWYRLKINGKYKEWPEEYWETRGRWITWGGTTFGHGGFYGPAQIEEERLRIVSFHEQIHVEQFEVAMITATLYGLEVGIGLTLWPTVACAWLIAALIWVEAFLLKAAAGWFGAYLRGEDPYLGSEHEEAAYALTELEEQKKTTE